MQEHLKTHGNDPHQSLASLIPIGSVRQELDSINDWEVQATLVYVAVAHRDQDTELNREVALNPGWGTPACS
jgi:hypothetical protein